MKHNQNEKGYTLAELLVTIGIIFTLFGLIMVDLLATQHKASINATVETMIADMRSQQTKAMTGINDGSGNGNSYGIHLSASSYVLFRGNSYVANDSGNFTLNLDKGSNLNSVLFSNNNIIFLEQSGEVSGYSTNSASFVVKSIGGKEQKTVTINRYGVVTSIQ